MFKKYHYLAVSLASLASLMLAAPVVRADHFAKDQCSANEIIGKKVKNLQDEDLGKIQDLIINADAGTVPYAVISHGGVLGAGRSRTAVPLDSLRSSADGKTMILAATKEQLENAPKTPTGAWANAASAEWAKNVDGFYGTPTVMERSRLDRERLPEGTDRTYVRDPAPKGAELLMTPADAALCQKVCESLDLVQVRVENGVTHIYGQVEDEETRRSVEAKVRAIPGVNRVESHLRVRNQ
jgi:sporulation protein YlmC with PRC-barrel domain